MKIINVTGLGRFFEKRSPSNYRISYCRLDRGSYHAIEKHVGIKTKKYFFWKKEVPQFSWVANISTTNRIVTTEQSWGENEDFLSKMICDFEKHTGEAVTVRLHI